MPLDSSRQLGQSVGAKLRAARQAKKYTQSQLAQPDFSVSYISAIERGQIQPSLRALEILSTRLEISTADLLPQNGQGTENNQALSEGVFLKEEERELLFLEAQVSLLQGNAEHAIALLCKLYAQKGARDQDIHLSALLGKAYLEGGYLQESEQMLASVARQAREMKNQLYPLILSLQGTVYAAMHNIASAIRLEEESQALLERGALRDIFLLAQVYSSLGQYYSALGQFEQARSMFEKAQQTVYARTSYKQLQPIYQDFLQYYKEQAELQKMTLYSYKWLQADWQIRVPTLRSEIHYALGRAWLASRPDEAYAYLLAEHQKASLQQDPLLTAGTSTHLAAWFMASDRFAEAEHYAREAQKLASPFGETTIVAETLLQLGEIVYRRQEYQEGDQYFESGLLMLDNLHEEEEEMATHLTRYAQLLESRGQVHKAIIYWKRAYEYSRKNRGGGF